MEKLKTASWFLRCLFFLLLIGSMMSCSRNPKELRIAIDPSWAQQNFGNQVSYVNGFVEDLLLELSKKTGTEFQKMAVNSGDLLDGLKLSKYDAVISSLKPYNFNQAQHLFSPIILDLGLVVVVPQKSKVKGLQEIGDKVVGVLSLDTQRRVMQHHPDLTVRVYTTASELFEALSSLEIEGAIVDRLQAISFVNNPYSGICKIVGPSLSDDGLRFVTSKTDDLHISTFLSKHLEKMSVLKQELLKKWNLVDQ